MLGNCLDMRAHVPFVWFSGNKKLTEVSCIALEWLEIRLVATYLYRLTPLVRRVRYEVCNVYYLYIVNVKLWTSIDFVFVCYSFHGAQTAKERKSTVEHQSRLSASYSFQGQLQVLQSILWETLK